MLLATTNSDLLLPASRSSFSRLLALRFPRKYHGYFQFERTISSLEEDRFYLKRINQRSVRVEFEE